MVRLRVFFLYRSNGCSGQQILGEYRVEYVVIRPANHGYTRVALVKEYFTEMVLRESISMSQRGSGKGGTCGAWFSEPAKKELYTEAIHNRAKTKSWLQFG